VSTARLCSSGQDFEVTLPEGWEVMEPLEGFEESDNCIARQEVERDGLLVCSKGLRFDFVPAVAVAYAKELMSTEALKVTEGIRYWMEISESEVVLAGHRALELTLELANEYRQSRVYLVPLAGGVLVIATWANRLGDGSDQCDVHSLDAAGLLMNFASDETNLHRAEELSATMEPPPIREIEPLPTNLDECYEALRHLLNPEELQDFQAKSEDELSEYHFGLGLWMRNNWGLWGGSPLAKHFNHIGICHPDDMSGIILDSFWRHLNGKPIRLEEQVQYYRKYWGDSLKCEPGVK
jgi:hypothetical protein